MSNLLKERAQMLAKARAFFAKRNILEVDVPMLSPYAAVDVHIDPMKVEGKGYLHTSPEYGMKKLLAKGSGDIYQISHVFRKEEVGRLHAEEFTMVEWYKCNINYDALIEETLNFIRLFLGDLPSTTMTYAKTFETYGKEADAPKEWDQEAQEQYILNFTIEPKLGTGELFVLTDYPASQSALARVENGVAKRFEVYYRGIELANGYHELTDADEQLHRFEAANQKRLELGKEALPIDIELIDALKQGLPDCCGVAVGFDRLLMLKLGLDSI